MILARLSTGVLRKWKGAPSSAPGAGAGARLRVPTCAGLWLLAHHPSGPPCLFPLYRTGNRTRGSVTGMGTCSPRQIREQQSLCPWAGPHPPLDGEWVQVEQGALEHITHVTNHRRHLVHRESLRRSNLGAKITL